MSVRKVITRRSNHFRVYVPSMKHGKPTPCESMLEAKFIRLIEVSPFVHHFEVQPSKEEILIGGEMTTYIPDVRVWFMDGREGWYEIKPSARLKIRRVANRIAAIRAHFAKTGRYFDVVTDEWLDEGPRASNVLDLMYHRREILTPTEREYFQRELQRNHPQTLADLCAVFGLDDAWRLLGLGIVGADLEHEITPASTIYLEGGHRHANLQP